MHRVAPEGHRVLVCAPYGRDAESLAKLLANDRYDVAVCSTLSEVANEMDEHIGAVICTEEALAVDLAPLYRALGEQPQWSDIPFVLLVGRQTRQRETSDAIRRRLPENAINVILLERPLSGESLLSATATAMRARQKQFEIRDRMAEIDEQNRRLAALLDHLPIGVAFVAREGETILSNPAFRRFQPDGQIPSRSPDGERRWIGYDEDGQRIGRDRFVSVRALKGERVPGIEFQFLGDDGDEIWTRVSGVPLRDKYGQVTGAISVIVDIDAQKRAQQALQNAANRLESEIAAQTQDLKETLLRLETEIADRERAESALRQAQKMEAVGQLTGGIAHDFNNMLTGVIGALDVMKRRMASGRLDDMDRFMDAALTSAERAAGLTARLLAFSRRQTLDSKPTDVNALLGSLNDLLQRTMSERINVRFRRCPDVPQAVVDPNLLENAILNLAINARDAMPDGGDLTIATEVVAIDAQEAAKEPGLVAGRYVGISVSDTGVGMDASLLEKVFEPFFTTKPIGQGTGLGLSMVYGFIKQSNGYVRIRSEVGTGTSVHFYLPIAETNITPQIKPDAIIHEGAGQSVLLVEDDNWVRMLICDVLQELGYVSVEANDAEAAIRLLQAGQHFDLMISDVGLPGMNGRQLAEVAHQRWPDLPILFVTGYAENARLKGEFLGTNMDMIAKPFKIEELSAKISEMIG